MRRPGQVTTNFYVSRIQAFSCIFMFNLIQKYNSKFVTTYMCICELILLATIAKAYKTSILIKTIILLN